MRRIGSYVQDLVDRVEACAIPLAAASMAAGGGTMEIVLAREERFVLLQLTDHRKNRSDPIPPPVIEGVADLYSWEMLSPEGVRLQCTFFLSPFDGPVIE
jgi:hypothetical protein